MELQPYVDAVREQLVTAAANSGDESRLAAERMTATIDAALRLALLEAITAAADEITLDLAPGSVEVRLRGRDPEFAVTTDSPGPYPQMTPPTIRPEVDSDDSGTARITLRLSESLKARVEQAAGREDLSVNAWLIRALSAATDLDSLPTRPLASPGRSFTGWVH